MLTTRTSSHCSGSLFALLFSRSSDRLQFEPFVEATVIDQIRLILLEGFRRHPEEQRRISHEMIAATASWAMYGAVNQWVDTPNRPPAEEFVATAIELVQPVMSAGAASVPSAPPLASHS